MRVNIRKTNPTKFMSGNLIALTTLGHLISLVVRESIPPYYLGLSPLVPFPFIVSFAVAGILLWAYGLIKQDWGTLQLSFVFSGIFYTLMNLSLLLLGLFNGAVMWTAAMGIIYMAYKMSPVELIRGK